MDYSQFGLGCKVDENETDIQIRAANSKPRVLTNISDGGRSTAKSPNVSPWSTRWRETIVLYKPPGSVSAQPEYTIDHSNAAPNAQFKEELRYKYEPAISLVGAESYHRNGNASHGMVQNINDIMSDLFSQSSNSPMVKNLAPAGRLDIDSTGLLVFTRDGIMAKTLLSGKVEKEYLVRIAPIPQAERGSSKFVDLKKDQYGKVNKIQVAKIQRRREAEGVKSSMVKKRTFPPFASKPSLPDLLEAGKYLLDGEREPLSKIQGFSWHSPTQFKITLNEGRKRQIRRMAEQYLGCKVVELSRVRVGPISIGTLRKGEWRFLSEREGEGLLGLTNARAAKKGKD